MDLNMLCCFQFRDTGSCSWGDACRFSHGGEHDSRKSGGSAAAITETETKSPESSSHPSNDTSSSSSHNRSEYKRKPRIQLQKMFVTGLPRYGTAKRWKNRIKDAYRNSDIQIGKLRLGVNSFGHLKGFFHIDVELSQVEQVLATPIHVENEETNQTFLLTIAKSIPGKVEMLFPSLTFQQKQQLKFDPTGIFSCTDEFTGDLITRLSLALCTIGGTTSSNGCGHGVTPTAPYSVLDMFGCVGGNAISYAKQFTRVTSVELDQERSQMLQHNVNVVGARVKCVQGDGILEAMSNYHSVVWLDPPWGGLEYTKDKVIIEDFDVVSQGIQMSMRQVILAVAPHTDLIVYRLPNNFNIASLLEWFVDPSNELCGDLGGATNDRPLPFRVRMGHKCTLLLICLPSSRANRRPPSEGEGREGERLSFGLSNLDAIVAEVHRIDKELLKELHPKFYDWEQKRDIRLKNWKGVEC